MEIKFGNGKTEFGPGVLIKLDGNEIATAIHAYLMAHSVVIDAATILVNDDFCQQGQIYVDPSGRVIADGIGWNGRGHKE